MTSGKFSLLPRRLVASWHVLEGVFSNFVGRTTVPRVIHYCPTWRCNQRCLGCPVSSRDPGTEMSTDDVIRMFSQMHFLDIVKIVGGEPFQREDLVEIGRYVSDHVRPYIFQIVTNGSMTDAIIEFAEKVGTPALNIRVSLSGLDENHERLTGGGSKTAVHETLDRLIKLQPSKGFSLGINYRLSSDTLDDYPKVVALYGQRGVDVVPGLHYSPFLTDIDIHKTKFEFDTGTSPKQLLEYMSGKERRRGNLSRLETSVLLRSSFHTAESRLIGQRHKKQFGCRELRNLMYVMPSGDLVYCGLRHTPAGNLAKDSFRSIWYSKAMEEHRRAIDACPGCPQAAVEIFSRLYLGRFF